MDVNVVGKQIDVGSALKEHVVESLIAAIDKYFGRGGQSHVTFSREGNRFRCDCMAHLDSGIVLNSTGEANDIYAAFELAAERLEKRLRRYKRRLKNHHAQRREPIEKIEASSYVIAAGDGDEDDGNGDPVIVTESTTFVSTLTVSEAVMQLELADVPALVFKNSAHGGLNVVYRRADGNVGWIDPEKR